MQYGDGRGESSGGSNGENPNILEKKKINTQSTLTALVWTCVQTEVDIFIHFQHQLLLQLWVAGFCWSPSQLLRGGWVNTVHHRAINQSHSLTPPDYLDFPAHLPCMFFERGRGKQSHQTPGVRASSTLKDPGLSSCFLGAMLLPAFEQTDRINSALIRGGKVNLVP